MGDQRQGRGVVEHLLDQGVGLLRYAYWRMGVLCHCV